MGDPDLLEPFEGLNPEEEKHSTFIDLHPRLGFPLAGASRFQLNIQVRYQNIEKLEFSLNKFLVNITNTLQLLSITLSGIYWFIDFFGPIVTIIFFILFK